MASVFAGDGVSFFQNANRAESDVLQVSDGRRDEIELAGFIFGRRRHVGDGEFITVNGTRRAMTC